MVLITGDTHGQFSRIIDQIEKFSLTAEDCIVILGDAGFNFYGYYDGDANHKRAVDRYGVPILCIHGNHEMRPATIPTYVQQTWHGGTVWVEPEFPNLRFAQDGQFYELEGRTAFVVGGAYSVDVLYRIARNPHNPKWWPDEQPDDEIKANVEAALARHGWKADMVFTHTCPARYTPVEAFLSGLDQRSVDRSTEEWLDSLEQRLDYNDWYCGHWHINKRIDKLHFLFEDMELLSSGETWSTSYH